MPDPLDERQVAIRAIATLVYHKAVMASLILEPAGVPADIYRPLITGTNAVTGRRLSKWEMGPLLLAELDKRYDGPLMVREIVRIAANWKEFHYAHDEYEARATVQKAREVMGLLDEIAAREERETQEAVRQALELMRREWTKNLREQSGLLLHQLEDLTRSDDHHRRGVLLELLLDSLFRLHEIETVESFRRNEGGEQIDGGFRLEGWHYLVECRWRERLADAAQMDALIGKVNRSGKQTMGLFVSINGWSDHVIGLLKQNPDKVLILMNGADLHAVLREPLDFREFLLAKAARLSFEAEPYLSAYDYQADL